MRWRNRNHQPWLCIATRARGDALRLQHWTSPSCAKSSIESTAPGRGPIAGKLVRGNGIKRGRYNDPQIHKCRRFVRADRTCRRCRNRLGTGKIAAREHHGCTQWRPYPRQRVKPENIPRQKGLRQGRGFCRCQRRWRRLFPRRAGRRIHRYAVGLPNLYDPARQLSPQRVARL